MSDSTTLAPVQSPLPSLQARTAKERADILADAAELDAINAATRARFGLGPVPVALLKVPERLRVRTALKAADEQGKDSGPVTAPARVRRSRAVRVKVPKAPRPPAPQWHADRASEAEIEDLRQKIFGTKVRGWVSAVRRAAGMSSVSIYQLKDGDITVAMARRLRAALAGGIEIGRQGRPPGTRSKRKEGGA